jgi:hypothetical protein
MDALDVATDVPATWQPRPLSSGCAGRGRLEEEDLASKRLEPRREKCAHGGRVARRSLRENDVTGPDDSPRVNERGGPQPTPAGFVPDLEGDFPSSCQPSAQCENGGARLILKDTNVIALSVRANHARVILGFLLAKGPYPRKALRCQKNVDAIVSTPKPLPQGGEEAGTHRSHQVVSG